MVDFPSSLIQSESGGNWSALNSEGYGGRLQFGEARLADAARAGIIPQGMTGAVFSRLPAEQQMAVENWHFSDIDAQAERMGLNRFIGQSVGGIPITRDAILSMAHLGGIGGARRFLESGGASNPQDSNGTSLADYARAHGGSSRNGSSRQQPPAQGQQAPPQGQQQYSAPPMQNALAPMPQQQLPPPPQFRNAMSAEAFMNPQQNALQPFGFTPGTSPFLLG